GRAQPLEEPRQATEVTHPEVGGGSQREEREEDSGQASRSGHGASHLDGQGEKRKGWALPESSHAQSDDLVSFLAAPHVVLCTSTVGRRPGSAWSAPGGGGR